MLKKSFYFIVSMTFLSVLDLSAKIYISELKDAAKNGDYDLVVKILNENKDVLVDDPLRWAAGEGHESIVDKLLPRAQSVDDALVWAVMEGHESIVDKLLPKAQSVDDALDWAAGKGHESIVDKLLPRAQSVDWALHRAAGEGHESIVDKLLPRAQSVDDALDWAAGKGHESIVDKLLPKAESVDWAFKNAASNGYESIVDKLLPRVQFVDYALEWAVMEGHESIVDKLLPKAQSVDDALDWAAGKGHESIVDKLLPKAQSVDRALEQAANNGYESIVDKLLPKVQSVDRALHWAVIEGHESIVDKLLPRAQSFSVKYALLYATSQGRESIVDRLLPKVQGTDDIFEVLEALENKKRYPKQYANIKEALMLGFYRSNNWVERLLRIDSEENFSFGSTQTEELNQKYKLKKFKLLQDFCKKQNLREASPLVGFYGELDCIASRVADVERKDHKEGFVTFVHGRNWEFNFLNDVWNMICALRDDKDTVSDKVSMRQRDIDCDVDKLYRARKNLVENGTVGGHLVSCTNDGNKDDGDGERSETTFLNYTGMSHLDCYGECSMRYVMANHSANGGASGYGLAQELIKKYGLERYQDKFDQLYGLHKESSDRGEMLTISVANDKVDDIVWPAYPGGYKCSKDKASQVVAECRYKIKDQSNDYVQTYRSDEDCPIFCAGALNIPGEGEDVVKIRSHHLADSEKYQEYQKRKQELFKDLKRQNVSVQRCES